MSGKAYQSGVGVPTQCVRDPSAPAAVRDKEKVDGNCGLPRSMERTVMVTTNGEQEQHATQISRSERVFAALKAGTASRLVLAGFVCRITRSFHRPATRVEDSINSALDKIAQGAQPQRPN